MSNNLLLFFGCFLVLLGVVAIALSRFEVVVTFDKSIQPAFPMDFRLSIAVPGEYQFKVFNSQQTQLNRVR